MTTRESIDTARLEALLEAATDGPWAIATTDGMGFAIHSGEHDTVALYMGRPDAALIVAAVNALPDLIAATKERGDLKERVAAHCEERDQALEDAADARARAEAAEAELAALRAGVEALADEWTTIPTWALRAALEG